MGRTSRRRRRLKSLLPSGYIANLGSDQNFIHLSQWMSKNGWSPTCRLTLANFPDTGRGLRTRQNLDAGSMIVSVPTRLLITTTTVASSDFEWIFRESSSLGGITTQQILAMFLIWERSKEEKSFWAPYLQTVPSHFFTPAFCSSGELACLPKFMEESILQQKEKILECFQLMQKVISSKQGPVMKDVGLLDPKEINEDNALSKASLHVIHQQESLNSEINGLFKLFTYEHFLWAWFAVNSRCVFLENSSKTFSNGYQTSDNDCLALAPILDMLNHSNDSKVKAALSKDGLNYELQTLVPFEKHSQVFIHYGSHPNSKLYIEYGFFLPENIHDSIELCFEDVFNAAKIAFPELSECSTNKYTFVKSHSLKKDLWLNHEGLSFNTTSLIYVFLTTDIVSHRSFTQKIFSSVYGGNEREMINVVGKLLANSKIMEFENTLTSMEQINGCSESFRVAKGLIREYINVLNRSKNCLMQA